MRGKGMPVACPLPALACMRARQGKPSVRPHTRTYLAPAAGRAGAGRAATSQMHTQLWDSNRPSEKCGMKPAPQQA